MEDKSIKIFFSPIRIRHYFCRITSESRKRVEKQLISKFDPFYNWRVGKFSALQIKEIAKDFLLNPGKELFIKGAGAYDYESFSFFIEAIREEFFRGQKLGAIKNNEEIHDIDSLSSQNWLNIRNRFLELLKENSKGFLPPVEIEKMFNRKEKGVFNKIDRGEQETNENKTIQKNNFFDDLEKDILDIISFESYSLQVNFSMESHNRVSVGIFDMLVSEKKSPDIMAKILEEITPFFESTFGDCQGQVKSFEVGRKSFDCVLIQFSLPE